MTDIEQVNRKALLLVAGLALLGCGSDGADAPPAGPACGDLTGTWAISYTRDTSSPGSCKPTSDPAPAVLTISTDGKGSAQILMQGTTGACPARVDGCKITTACEIKYSAANGALLATETDQYSLTFGEDSFTGYDGAAILPTNEGIAAGFVSCSANFNVNGKRK